MKILQIHNKYQLGGGEDAVLENERQVLEQNGNAVFQFIRENREIEEYGLLKKALLFQRSVWSSQSMSEIRKTIEKVNPDICHVHNYMPLISPSVFAACQQAGVPVVQTLHNYRLLCANAYLFRDGQVCEECIGKSLYHALNYNCYRDSKVQTLTVARMIEANKKRGIFTGSVDGYICLTRFAKNKFADTLPEEKLFLKPNFLPVDPGFSVEDQGYYLFIGRLEVPKGISTLAEAVQQLPELPFRVAGSGPLVDSIKNIKNIEYLGQLTKENIIKQLKNSRLLVLPSRLYETFGLVAIEAFACGKPVIASRLGAMAEIVQDGYTGLHFTPGDAEDLAAKIRWANEHPEEMAQMGRNARKEYEAKYTAERNYEMLLGIYERVIERKKLKGES